MAEEREVLARQACGDIPPRYCHVVDVEINGDAATVWLLTDGPSWFEEYEVAFIREDGVWRDAGGTGGFQDGTPQRVHELAAQLEARLGA